MAAEGGYVKTGWLFKKSDSIFSTWGKRWICVKSRQLLCFRTDKDVTPKYTMSLERGKVLEEGVTKKKSFCFSVLNLDEVWVFSADDEESRVAWMKAIKSCIPSNTMKKSQSCSDVLADAGVAPALTPRSHPNLAAATGFTNSSPALPTSEKKPGPSEAPPNDSDPSKLKKSGSGKEENKENAGKDGTKDKENSDKEKDNNNNNKDKENKDKEKEKENRDNHDKRPEPTKVIVHNLQELCQDKDGKYFVDRSGLAVESIEKNFGLLLSIINFIQRHKKFVDPNAKPSEHHRGRPKPDEAAIAKLEEEIISPTPPEIKKLFKHPEQVGEGGFGLVVRADVSGDKGKPKLPSTVAIKKMGHVSLKERSNNCREIGFLQRLDHPNIVKYYRTYRGYNLKESKPNPDEIWVIMEYLEGGTLSQARSSHKFHEDNIAYIARELLTGIAYLHSLNLAHRDLKSANVMLSVEGGVKMIDFGLCADLSSGRRDDVCGSPFWMPPEMIKNESHGVEVDIWSFAICLLELANGAPPHEHSATKAMFIAATEGYPQPFDNSDKWSSDMKNFFAKCLVIDPSKRAKAKELLKDPWLNRASTKKTMKNILTDIFIRDTLQSVGFGGF